MGQHISIWTAVGRANNFVVFRPRKNFFLVDVKLERTEDNDELIRKVGCEEIEYQLREGRYRWRVYERVRREVENAFVDVFKKAYED